LQISSGSLEEADMPLQGRDQVAKAIKISDNSIAIPQSELKLATCFVIC